MDIILAGMDGGQKLFLFLGLALIVAMTIVTTAQAIWSDSDIDEDELAERIEESVKASTLDLLVSLEHIAESNDRIAHAVEKANEPVRMEKR